MLTKGLSDTEIIAACSLVDEDQTIKFYAKAISELHELLDVSLSTAIYYYHWYKKYINPSARF